MTYNNIKRSHLYKALDNKDTDDDRVILLNKKDSRSELLSFFNASFWDLYTLR